MTLLAETVGTVPVDGIAPLLSDRPQRRARRESDRWSRWADEADRREPQVA